MNDCEDYKAILQTSSDLERMHVDSLCSQRQYYSTIFVPDNMVSFNKSQSVCKCLY